MLILIYGHGLGIDIYKKPLIKEKVKNFKFKR